MKIHEGIHFNGLRSHTFHEALTLTKNKNKKPKNTIDRNLRTIWIFEKYICQWLITDTVVDCKMIFLSSVRLPEQTWRWNSQFICIIARLYMVIISDNLADPEYFNLYQMNKVSQAITFIFPFQKVRIFMDKAGEWYQN